MASTNLRSSRSASPIGARRAARRAQTLLMFRRPRQVRARKRHRGGGGLAVPGPFKRIARAGGQKVTIRTAQRGVFANSSELLNYYFATAVTISAWVTPEEIPVNQRCSAPACGRGRSEVVSPGQR